MNSQLHGLHIVINEELDLITCIGCGDICYMELGLIKIGCFLKDMAHENHLDSLLIDDSCEHYTLHPKTFGWITNYQHGYNDLCHDCSETGEWRSYMEQGQCRACNPL